MLKALWGQSVGDFVPTEVWLSQKNTQMFLWHSILNYILYIIDCQMRLKVYLGSSTILNQQIQDVHNISNTFSFILQMFLYFVSVQHSTACALSNFVTFIFSVHSGTLICYCFGCSVQCSGRFVNLEKQQNTTGLNFICIKKITYEVMDTLIVLGLDINVRKRKMKRFSKCRYFKW